MPASSPREESRTVRFVRIVQLAAAQVRGADSLPPGAVNRAIRLPRGLFRGHECLLLLDRSYALYEPYAPPPSPAQEELESNEPASTAPRVAADR